jgi:hypothetical protein
VSSNYERDQKATIKAMRAVVIPVATPLLRATRWVQAEAVQRSELGDSLDIGAGIDWNVQLEGSTAQFGVSSRVQWDAKVAGTFTIRARRTSGRLTEDAKQRDRLSQTAALISRFTLHAYCATPKGEGPLLSLAICETRDLFEYMDGHELRDRRDPARFENYWRNSNDGSENVDEFFCVPWPHMSTHHRLLVWPPAVLVRPPGNTMRAPGNTFASVATYKLTEEGHAKDDVRAAVVAMKGDGPDPLLTPDEVDELRAALGAEPLGDYVPPKYPPAWLPQYDCGHWNERWGTDLPTPLPRRAPRPRLP